MHNKFEDNFGTTSFNLCYYCKYHEIIVLWFCTQEGSQEFISSCKELTCPNVLPVLSHLYKNKTCTQIINYSAPVLTIQWVISPAPWMSRIVSSFSWNLLTAYSVLCTV
jgi:hypothetical protein